MNRAMSPARFACVVAMLFLPLMAVLYRAGAVQLGQGRDMRGMAEEQYLRETRLTAPRGQIVDRAGRALALSVKVPSVFAEPRNIPPERVMATAKALQPVLNVPTAHLAEKLASGRGFAWLARRVKPEVATSVRRLSLPGVGITDETKRFYPSRELAAHVLGYTNIDGQGQEGVELLHEKRLHGEDKSVDGFRDARGGRLLLGELASEEPAPGDEITLTLDAQIQFITEQALARAVTDHGAVGGFAVVMEPSTGAILAMASYPTFNPNDLKGATPDARRNRAVVDAYEPGSTMKSVLLSVALSAGTVRLTDVIDCENGVFALGRHRIRDTHKADKLTVEQVLAQSSNIGALKIGMAMGRQRWGQALADFGFGRKSGLMLNGESAGIVVPFHRWSEAMLATTSFGQGISVTGVQLTTAMAAIANGGVLMQPRLVERIRSADGKQEEVFPPVTVGRVVEARAARLTLKAMEKVVSPEGTAPLAVVPGVRVAGKTGTSQKVDPGTRRYGAKRIASFAGVAPAQDPKLVVLVVVDEPTDSPYGGVVAAPAFREIAMTALPLMGVGVQPATVADTKSGESRKEPTAVSVSTPEWLVEARRLRDKLAMDDPQDGIDEPGEVVVTLGAAVPDLRGKSARSAIRDALAAGLEPALEGSGLVVSQSPAPGQPLPAKNTIRLKLGLVEEDG